MAFNGQCGYQLLSMWWANFCNMKCGKVAIWTPHVLRNLKALPVVFCSVPDLNEIPRTAYNIDHPTLFV